VDIPLVSEDTPKLFFVNVVDSVSVFCTAQEHAGASLDSPSSIAVISENWILYFQNASNSKGQACSLCTKG
jgi:hypothetical protein